MTSMRPNEPEAIIFDCDGVLVDSEVIHITAELELLAHLGLVYEREAYLTRFVGLSNADSHLKPAIQHGNDLRPGCNRQKAGCLRN